jgi:hypothetical protein
MAAVATNSNAIVYLYVFWLLCFRRQRIARGPNRCSKPGRIDSTGCHDGHCHSGMKTWRLTAWCMQQLSEYDDPQCLLYFCMPTPPVECKPTVRSNSGSHSILLGVEASPAFAPPNFWLVYTFSM